ERRAVRGEEPAAQQLSYAHAERASALAHELRVTWFVEHGPHRVVRADVVRERALEPEQGVALAPYAAAQVEVACARFAVEQHGLVGLEHGGLQWPGGRTRPAQHALHDAVRRAVQRDADRVAFRLDAHEAQEPVEAGVQLPEV